MDQTEEIVYSVVKKRSYVSCITEGIRYSFCHLGLLLRYLWPSMFLASILTFPFIIFFLGQVDAMLRKWIELGYLPKVKARTLWPEIKHCSYRNLVTYIICGILCFLMSCGILLPLILGLNIWWSIVAFLVMFLLMIPFDCMEFQLSYTDVPVMEAIIGGVRKGFRHYGRLFAFELLCVLILTIVSILTCLPIIAVMLVLMKAHYAMIAGDVIDLPLIFPLYAVLAYVASVAIELVCLLIYSFCKCLMWGSLVEEVPTDSEMNV